MFLVASFSDGPTFDRLGAVATSRTWPHGSLHWADTPEARNPCTKPGQAPGFVLPQVPRLTVVSITPQRVVRLQLPCSYGPETKNPALGRVCVNR